LFSASVQNLFLSSFLGGRGNLSGSSDFLGDFLDDTDGNGLSHISDGKSSQRWVFGENFNNHWLGGDEFNHGSISRFNVLWFLFEFFTTSSVDLGQDFREFAGNVCSVAIEDWGVTSMDLSRVIQNDNLSNKEISFLRWVDFGVSANESSSKILVVFFVFRKCTKFISFQLSWRQR